MAALQSEINHGNYFKNLKSIPMKYFVLSAFILFTAVSALATPPVRPVSAAAIPSANVNNLNCSYDNDPQSYAVVNQNLLSLNTVTCLGYTFAQPVKGLFQIDLRMTTGLLSLINEDNIAQGFELRFYDAGGQMVAMYGSGGFVTADVLSGTGKTRLLAFVNTDIKTMSITVKKLAGILSSDIYISNVQNTEVNMNLVKKGTDNSAGLLHGHVLNPEKATDAYDPNTDYATFQFPLVSLLGNTSAVYDWLPATPAGALNGEEQSVYLTIAGSTPLTVGVLSSLNITLTYTDNSSASFALSDPVVHVSVFQGTNKRLVEVPMNPVKSLRTAAITKSDLLSANLLNNMKLYNIFTGTASSIIVLPVKLVSFTGIMKNKAVQLEWKTEGMESTASFEVQRSADSKEYTAIGNIHAGTLSSATYNFNDNAPLAGKSYYRLRIINADGSFTYSSVVMIKSSGEITITVWPNPAQNFIKLNASVAGVVITDATGKPSISAVNIRAGDAINISQLKPGIYFVRPIQDDEKSPAIKIIKN
jgi:hypothetical protein